MKNRFSQTDLELVRACAMAAASGFGLLAATVLVLTAPELSIERAAESFMVLVLDVAFGISVATILLLLLRIGQPNGPNRGVPFEYEKKTPRDARGRFFAA